METSSDAESIATARKSNAHNIYQVGRVGALAIALGVGSALASMPMALADSRGSAGSTGSAASSDSATAPRTDGRTRTRISVGGGAPAGLGAEATEAAQAPVAAESGLRAGGARAGRGNADVDGPPVPARRSPSGIAAPAPAYGPLSAPDRGGSTPAPDLAESPAAPMAPGLSGDTGTPATIPPTTTASATGAMLPAPAQATTVTAPVAAQAPVMTAAPRGAVRGVGTGLITWLQPGGTDESPAMAPLAWAALALSRRELGNSAAAPAAAAATSSGEPADPLAAFSPAASATASLTSNPVADFIRFFIGSGTADNPNAGILIGNGYSYTAATCTSAQCNGGNGGLFGNGGNGYGAGNGG